MDKETGKTLSGIQDKDPEYIPFELETGRDKSNFVIGTKMVCIPLNWPAYIAFASMLADLWDKGVWKDIHQKYFKD